MFFPIKQATLLIPSASKDDPHRKHLFIILTNQQGEEKHVLMVSVSSVRVGCFVDNTCLLYQGDHAFIKHDSFIRYSKATIIEAAKLMRGVNDRKLIYKELIDMCVFERICQGVCLSPHTPHHVKSFFELAD